MVNLCKCGCGQTTSIPQWNDRHNGGVKGVSLRLVKGHNLRLVSFRFSQGFTANNSNWKGTKAKRGSGRDRARNWFKNLPACQVCGNPKSERHHRDDNPLNNEASNIQILCRRCHMQADGRALKLANLSKVSQPKALLTRWGRC